jgi:hypothetical protein
MKIFDTSRVYQHGESYSNKYDAVAVVSNHLPSLEVAALLTWAAVPAACQPTTSLTSTGAMDTNQYFTLTALSRLFFHSAVLCFYAAHFTRLAA